MSSDNTLYEEDPLLLRVTVCPHCSRQYLVRSSNLFRSVNCKCGKAFNLGDNLFATVNGPSKSTYATWDCEKCNKTNLAPRFSHAIAARCQCGNVHPTRYRVKGLDTFELQSLSEAILNCNPRFIDSILAPVRAAKRYDYEVTSLGADKYSVRNPKKNTIYTVEIKSDYSDSCDCETYLQSQTSCIHLEHARLKLNLPSLAESLLERKEFAYAWFDKASFPPRISIGWQGSIEAKLRKTLVNCPLITSSDSLEKVKLALEDAQIPFHVPFNVADALTPRKTSFANDVLTRQIHERGTAFLKGVIPELYSHQVEGALFLAANQRALLLDEMGLGKTLQAIAAACLLREFGGVKSCLIVSPKSVGEHWQKEIKRFLNEDAAITSGNASNRESLYSSEAFFKITTLETLRRDYPAVGKHELIIVDEVHKARNPNTISNRILRSFESRFFIGLTGTAIEKSLLDLYGLMQVLRPANLETPLEFYSSHLMCDDFGKPIYTCNPAFFYCRYESHMLRRTKEDIDTNLPSLNIEEIELSLTSTQENLAKPLIDELDEIKERLKQRWDPDDFQRQRWLINRAVELADSSNLLDPNTDSSSKLDWLKGFLSEQCCEKNEKVVIFTRWTRVQDLITELCDVLNLKWCSLSGRDNEEKRKSAINRFNNDSEIDVFVSTDAGGLGVNLQASRTIVLFEPAWNPSQDLQRINRVHRIGQKKDVTAYLLLTSLDAQFTILSHNKKMFAINAIAQARKTLEDWPAPTWDELAPVAEYLRRRSERIVR